jgi:hypothetical protein
MVLLSHMTLWCCFHIVLSWKKLLLIGDGNLKTLIKDAMLWHCLLGINMANACIIVVDEDLIAILNYNLPNMCLMR